MKAGLRIYIVNDQGDLLEQVTAPQLLWAHAGAFVAGAIVGALVIALASCAPSAPPESKPAPAKFTPPAWWTVRYAAAGSKVEVRTGQGGSPSVLPSPRRPLRPATANAVPLHASPGPSGRAGFTPRLTNGKVVPIVRGVNDIRSLREQLGTQQKVGERLGITRRAISNYERFPERAPDWYRLALLGLAAQKQSPGIAAPGLLTDPTR